MKRLNAIFLTAGLLLTLFLVTASAQDEAGTIPSSTRSTSTWSTSRSS